MADVTAKLAEAKAALDDIDQVGMSYEQATAVDKAYAATYAALAAYEQAQAATPAPAPSASAKAEAKPLTDERLREMHHEDEFGLYCDDDDFLDIARSVESECARAWGVKLAGQGKEAT